eukprot:m.285872 g.285872  ORF g.285872 m.285872 type:complete len:431 (+) comp11468_c0_seq1:1-1293(+)
MPGYLPQEPYPHHLTIFPDHPRSGAKSASASRKASSGRTNRQAISCGAACPLQGGAGGGSAQQQQMASAKEAARQGRLQQLAVLEQFDAGKAVTFAVHNRPEGYKLAKGDVAAVERTPRRVAFAAIECLLDAASYGDVEAVKRLVGTDSSCINQRDADGQTALHRACLENHLNIASFLVLNGALVNALDNDWWTPLHTASCSGAWRIANFLISHGARVDAVNCEGDLPIDLVADSKVENVLKAEMDRLGLSDEMLDEYRDIWRQTMLADVKRMIERGESLNEPDQAGATLLHIATCNGYDEVVELLVKQPGIDINARDANGNTPLHLASFFQQYECAMLLAMLPGIEMEARNDLDQKPIVLSEDATMIRLLSALHKRQSESVEKAPMSRTRHGGRSINRSTRAKKHEQAHKDVEHEAQDLAHVGSDPDEE